MKRLLNLMLVIALVSACGSDGGDGNGQQFTNAFQNNGGAATNQTQNIQELRNFVQQGAFQRDIRGNNAIRIVHESAGQSPQDCDFFGIDFDCMGNDVINNEYRVYEYLSGAETFEGAYFDRTAIQNYLLSRVLNPNIQLQIRYLSLQQAPMYYALAIALGARQDAQMIEVRHPTGDIYYFSFDLPIEANPLWEQTTVFSGSGITFRWNYLVDFVAQ